MSHILFLSRWLPYPPSNGSKLRIYNLLRALASQHRVTLLTFTDQEGAPVPSELHCLCRRVEAIPWKPFDPGSGRARAGFLSFAPRSTVDTFSPAMQEQIVRAVAEGPDLVIASQFDMAVYSRWFRHLPALFEEVEVAVLYERFQRPAPAWQRLRAGLTWLKHRHYLGRLLRGFRACTVVSEQERALLARAVPTYRPVEIVPNCIDLTDYCHVQKRVEPRRLIFTGSLTYQVNYEAIYWFLSEVYPLVRAQVPDVQLLITGEHGDLPLPPTEGVIRSGLVSDISSLIAASAVSLAPILTGGGTRLKIVEAMALRTPVVSTRKGAEGLAVRDEEHLLLADTPEAFAGALVRLLHEPALGGRLAQNGYALVRQQYDWRVVAPHFLQVVERLLGASRPAPQLQGGSQFRC